jgi:hypothetical protein
MNLGVLSAPKAFRAALVWVVLFAFIRPMLAADSLNVRVLEGEGAINNVRSRMARAPVVEVQDAQGIPVAGASVTFQAPATGPGGVFGSERVLIAQTDASGRAVGIGLVPNSIAGPFQIRVTVSYQAQMASATINQVNASPSESKSSKKLLWVALAIGAGAGGALAATHSGKSSSTPSTTGSGATLVAGSPTFGPPQ